MRTRIWAALWAGFWIACISPTAQAAITNPDIDRPAGETLALSLEEAVALALRDNRGIRAVRLMRVLDRFDLFLTQRSYFPTGGITASSVRRRSSDGTTQDAWTYGPQLYWHSPVGTSASVGWTRSVQEGGASWQGFQASIRQPLLRGAGLDVNMAPLRQARIEAELAHMREEDAVAGLIDQVTYAYRGLVQAQIAHELSKEALVRSQTLLETNTLLIDAGRMAAADIVQTQSDVASQEVALFESERGLKSAQTQILQLLALSPSTTVAAIDQVEVAPVDIDADHAVQQAFEGRRDLQAQRLGFEQLVLAEKLARNSRLWDLSIIAQYDRLDGRGFVQPQSSHSVGIQLDVPLGDFSGRRSVMGATTALNTAELTYREMLDRTETQVREAVSDVQARWRQLQAALRARDLAIRSLELHQERLQAGRATNFEVLSLQAALRSAEAQALAARIAYLNGLTALDQLTGRTLETWRISIQP